MLHVLKFVQRDMDAYFCIEMSPGKSANASNFPPQKMKNSFPYRFEQVLQRSFKLFLEK